jgi:hypothetical protein
MNLNAVRLGLDYSCARVTGAELKERSQGKRRSRSMAAMHFSTWAALVAAKTERGKFFSAKQHRRKVRLAAESAVPGIND